MSDMVATSSGEMRIDSLAVLEVWLTDCGTDSKHRLPNLSVRSSQVANSLSCNAHTKTLHADHLGIIKCVERLKCRLDKAARIIRSMFGMDMFVSSKWLICRA